MSYLAMLERSRNTNQTTDTANKRGWREILNARNPLPKPAKTSFEGFPSIGARHVADAVRILNLAGVRIMFLDSGLTLGVWEDLDCPEVRAALRAVGMSELPVVHLEGPSVPIDYKFRRCPDRLSGQSFQAWLKHAEQLQAARERNLSHKVVIQ